MQSQGRKKLPKVMPDIQDQDYLDFIGDHVYRFRYFRWKDRMLSMLDDILAALERSTPEEVIEELKLTPRDLAMLVRLNYITKEDAKRLDLIRIERSIPMV